MAIAWHAHSHSHKIAHGHDMSMTIAKNVGDPLIRHPIIRNPFLRTVTLNGTPQDQLQTARPHMAYAGPRFVIINGT